MSPDHIERKKALALCQSRLDLADRINARCCVNIAGSIGLRWDGPHPGNLTPKTFDRIVETVRKIVDGVKPRRTYFTLETMPWMYPDSADSYLRLIRAVGRERFAVHLDPVNIVCSPQLYQRTTELLRECFRKLGRRIRSCHAKDILLGAELTVHLSEVRPGLGVLDYRTYLTELNRLDPDMTLLIEHLPDAKEDALAARYIRSVAKRVGVKIK